MAYNDESLSDKILRLTNTVSGTIQNVASSYQNRTSQTEQLNLKKAKYLYELDNNVYTASSKKALAGIESMFYGNTKTGVNGFFKDQLNDSNYENYEASTSAMLDETLSVDYLMKNYGMTAGHAEKFINEYSDQIRGEANQRTQTNTWMAMSSYLGADQESYTALMAETGNSVTEQWALSKENYYANGGPSWDITGEYNPDKIENKLNFGYSWSISTGKTYVDTNLGKTGITFEQIVDGALSYYDNAMSEMGDGSNISNATISASREEFEKFIRSYISTQSGNMYTESQDKARNASNAIAQIRLEGNYVDREHFEELIKDAGLSRENVYDLSYILSFEEALFGSETKSTTGSTRVSGATPEENLEITQYYNNYFNDYGISTDECEEAINIMESTRAIDNYTANALRKELENRTTFVTENYSKVENTIRDYLQINLDDATYALIEYEIENEPSFKRQIHRVLASHPEWDAKDLKKYAEEVAISMQSKEFSKEIDSMLEINFGEATGYAPEYSISDDDAYTVRANIYSGKYSHLLRPDVSESITSAIYNEQFSSEKELENAVSLLIFGKEYSEKLSNYEKNVIQANIMYHSINAKEFKEVTDVLEKIDVLKDENENYRMVDVYSFGAGAVAGDKVYFIDNNGYLNVMVMEVGDSNWNALHKNNDAYGVMLNPGTMTRAGKMNINELINITPQTKEESYNPFGPQMKQTNEILEKEANKVDMDSLTQRVESKGNQPSLSDMDYDLSSKLAVDPSSSSALVFLGIKSRAQQIARTIRLGGQTHEQQ